MAEVTNKNISFTVANPARGVFRYTQEVTKHVSGFRQIGLIEIDPRAADTFIELQTTGAVTAAGEAVFAFYNYPGGATAYYTSTLKTVVSAVTVAAAGYALQCLPASGGAGVSRTRLIFSVPGIAQIFPMNGAILWESSGITAAANAKTRRIIITQRIYRR